MANSDTSVPWRRPDDIGPYPREWDRFEGQRPMPDGRVPRFWIRDLTEEELEEAVAFMMKNFLAEEQMAKATDTKDDPLSVADMDGFWRFGIRQRVSLAAFTDWPDGREHLAGLNLLAIVRSTDPHLKMKGVATQTLMILYEEMLSSANVFERYDVSCYMAGFGLSVNQQFRGQNIGLRLLRARQPLCAALRVPLTVTLFSGPQSQKQAERADFELLETRQYADFVLEDGSRPYATTTWPCAKLMAKYYGPQDGL